MSERALEFVETWVSQKIDAMKFPTTVDGSHPKALASQCMEDARRNGIAESEIDEAFDDLAAFIAGQIEEAHDRDADRSGELHPGELVADDDPRLVDEEEDEVEKDAKGA